MNETVLSIQVPAELNIIGGVVKSVVTGIQAKEPVLTVLTNALPILFAEGTKLAEVKAELASPEIFTFAGLLLGQLIALYIANAAQANAPVAPVVAAPVA